MNFYAIPNFFVAILILITGVMATLKNRRSKINRLFFLLTSSAFIWQLGTGLAISAKNPPSALIATRIAFLGIALIPVFSYHLSFYISARPTNKILNAGYIFALLFFIPLSWTPLVLNGVYSYTWGFFFKAGRLHPVFMAFFIYYMLLVFLSLFLSFKRETKPLEKNRKKYFLIALFIAYIGSIDYLPTYGVKIYPFGYLTLICFILIFAYAILRFQIMDINIVLTRAGIFAVVYSLILVIPFVLVKYFQRSLYMTLGDNWWIIILFIGMMLATFGPFIYTSLRRRTENILLKEQRRYQNTLKQASIGMTRIRDLTRLLNLIAHIVTRTVKIAYIGIYIYHEEAGEYILQVCRDKGRRHLTKFPQDNPLIAWLMLHKKPLLYEEIKRLKEETHDATHIHLEENMRSLSASVVIPCLLQDRIIGFFALGEKISGQIYTAEDLNVFQILASQAALAIENALFFEEAKVMQEQIAQAEKMATIGTMADGLSHQINNRFHALSLIAADTIDTIKMTDTSNCSPEVKAAFNQISHALERVRANVMQGGEVVRGMLKYTRKGDEGLEPLTLDQILDSTLEMVQYKVKLSEIDIIRNYPKDHPKIRGNSVQLQEALFNFIDNGYDSTVERKTMLKEPDYRGRLTFSALSQQENGTLLITIEDNGMGIKDEDKKKLFTPFFTTKVSSRQGTGLGLYVLRRVIEDFHKGKIWFESEYGKGTKFFMQLPIAKE